jgi:hypothetical protein
MKQPEISITLETITPKVASEYLRLNEQNRSPIPRQIELIAEQISEGKWKVTGETVKFSAPDGDGKIVLLDGQNRLAAIIKAGQAIQSFVARNVPVDTRPVIDTGRSRSGAHVLSAAGYSNVFMLGSAARYLWMIEHRSLSERPLTNQQILDTVVKYKDLSRFILEIFSNRFARPGVLMAGLYWINRYGGEQGDEFMTKFLSGADLPMSSPIYVLRERFLNDRTMFHVKHKRLTVLAMLFRTFDYYTKGITSERIRATRPEAEDFPWPKFGKYVKQP